MRKIKIFTSLLMVIFTIATPLTSYGAVKSKPAEVYPLKVFLQFDAKAKKICVGLVDPKLTDCLTKIINKDPKPVVLRRSILAASGSDILRGTVASVVRDIESLSAFNGVNPNSKTLQVAAGNVPNGAVSVNYSDKSKSIKLVIPLAEEGRVVLIQVATISIVNKKVVVEGKDVFGRSFA